MRLASCSGELFAAVYGRPNLVIGVERAGTALTARFATAAGADQSVLIRQQRRSTQGNTGRARRLLARMLPALARRLYKRMLFKPAVRVSRQLQRRLPIVLDDDNRSHLATRMDRQRPQLIVIVDDAIDSGGTVQAILNTLGELSPQSRVAVFTLTTTAGNRVTAHQLNLFADLVDYQEGDLGNLADDYRSEAAWQATRPRPVENPGKRLIYLDLNDTLVPNADGVAARCLRSLLWSRGNLFALGRLASQGRQGQWLHAVDAAWRRLSPALRKQFVDRLARELASEMRWSLAAVCRAPRVQAKLVTAAPAYYREAVEQALGIDVLVAGTPATRAALIADDVQQTSQDSTVTSTLILGRRLGQGLEAMPNVVTAPLGPDDATGLQTLLAAKAWWQSARGGTRKSPAEAGLESSTPLSPLSCSGNAPSQAGQARS